MMTSIIDDEDKQGRRRNLIQQQRQLLKTLDSNPQFFNPSQQSQQQQQSLDASSVFGLVFIVRTKVDESIQFTGFEFYTTPTAESHLFYELYAKEGEFWETADVLGGGTVLGGLDTFDLILKV